MSFGGFGSSNNNQSPFGGFGGGNTSGGFGSTNNASSGGSLFGGNTSTAGGFGGFGSNNNNNNNASSPFGASKPAFGATNTTTSGGGLFGNNTATSGGGFGGGGGFGNTANTGGGFGSSTGGGLFGQQNKPATSGFGSTNTGGNSLFGGGSTGGGFGAANTSNPFSTNQNTQNTSSGFGASNAGGGGFSGFGGASSGAAGNNNQGTANTPFQAFSEKDPGPSGATSLYQSITFQQPYQNKSFEELRVEDYAQGRKFGNTNGQAGSFGQSTGFGGFGSATSSAGGGGLFGGNNNSTATAGASGGFGSTGGGGFGSTNTGGGFGSNTSTGGGLFGGQQSKPASGGLFGSTNANSNTGGFGSATNNTGGGLFGGSSGGGFGSTANNNTGGGLFGSNNNQQQQQQSKPAFGGFGSTNNNSTAGGFGGNTNTGGGLFGSNANSNTNAGGGGLFGGQNNQQQSNPFGASSNTGGGGLFGNQQKPAGTSLFGNNNNTSNTGGGLFGAQNNQQQSNPFGGSTNTGGGGLFGNQNQNQNKPPGTGLFGSTANNNSGGLFGGQNNQQQGGGGLFGSNNNNANAGSSLFGNQNKPAGGGLFGGSQNANNNTGGGLSLFGGNQSQQQNSNPFGGGFGQNNQNQQNNNNSLFGSLNQNTPQGTPQNQLHASLTGAPYGNEQLFSSLGAPSPPVGPLATPLSGGRPAPRKTPSLLASARLNTPVYSPRGGSGRNGTYGFSYSTYGTPGSAFTSGSLTPGAHSLLKPTGSLSSALTNRLNKSFSASNLRGDGTPSDGRSLLRPSAFSPEGTPGFQSGSVRKLKIDRSLRTDLFGPNSKAIEAAKEADAPALRKRVSFENGGAATSTAESSTSNALVRTEEPEEENSPPSLMRSGPSKSKAPEMEQVNGQLTTVPEDTEVTRPSSAPGTRAAEKTARKNEPGEYWTKPAMKDLKNMSRQQLKSIGNFVVGREGVGRIEFGSVDLTNTPLEDICGGVVKLNPRSATVYEDDHNKPEMGKALNVPSTIYLENSWPRSHGGKKPVSARSGKEYDKHIARLKRVGGTHFVAYNPDTGVWSFKVDHFTTYGLDDESDDESGFLDQSQMQESSALSDPPQTPTEQQDDTMQSMDTGTGEVEDTFQFKLDRRSQLSNMPGGLEFDGVTYDYDDPSADEDMGEDEHMMSGGLGETDEDVFGPGSDVIRPVQSPPSPVQLTKSQPSGAPAVLQAVEDAGEEEKDVPGSFMPRSILKPTAALRQFDSPEMMAKESWEDQLQRTISPKKRDRQALKEMQKSLLRAQGDEVIESPFKKTLLGLSTQGQPGLDESYLAQRSARKQKTDSTSKGATLKQLDRSENFKTAMDIMHSFGEQPSYRRKIAAGGKGFEYPYPKRPRLLSDDMSSDDAKWHNSFKPSFSNAGILTYSVPGSAPHPSGEMKPALRGFVGERYDVRFAQFERAQDLLPEAWNQQYAATNIDDSSGFPAAQVPSNLPFQKLAKFAIGEAPFSVREESVWMLCSILFDPPEFACREYMQQVPRDRIDEFKDLMRLDALKDYWSKLVARQVQDGLKRARTAEEKALLHLTQNDIVSACEVLIAEKDFKLATLIAQLPASQRSADMMHEQIIAWIDRNDWSEMSDGIRALYTILSGEVCTVKGKPGTPENRVKGFQISERFQLNWEQAFALRLFYGRHETIQAAIEHYEKDVADQREPTTPMTQWAKGQKTNNVLSELLSIYAKKKPKAIFEPMMVSGSVMNSRLAWQLAQLLNARKLCTTPQDILDKITYDFATELADSGNPFKSVWVLLHIRDATARQNAIWALLQRRAGQFTPDNSDHEVASAELTNVYAIPAPMVWMACALYAKAVFKDPVLETEWLLNAGDVDAAHEVLCTAVGPQAIIEQDYETISQVLQLFPRPTPDGWQRGGQVYMDFIRLVNARAGQRLAREDEAAMKRLRSGLAEMAQDAMRQAQVERVAVFEMKKVLDEVFREHDHRSKDKEDTPVGGASGDGNEMLRLYQQGMRGV